MDFHASLTLKTLDYLNRQRHLQKVFHYTPFHESIISTGVVRMYDIWTMKDKKEFDHAVMLFLREAKKRGLEDYFKTFNTFIEKEKNNPTMIFCVASFTRHNHKKRHWNEYAGPKGKCFEFKSSDLELIEQHKKNMLLGSNVIYSKSEQKRLINRAFDYFRSSLKEIRELALGENDELERMTDLFFGMFETVAVFALIFKTERYIWEDEYRLIGLIGSNKFQSDDNNGRKYVELRMVNQPRIHG